MTPNFCLHVWWPSGHKEERMVMLLLKADSLWPSDSTGSSDPEGGVSTKRKRNADTKISKGSLLRPIAKYSNITRRKCISKV